MSGAAGALRGSFLTTRFEKIARLDDGSTDDATQMLSYRCPLSADSSAHGNIGVEAYGRRAEGKREGVPVERGGSTTAATELCHFDYCCVS